LGSTVGFEAASDARSGSGPTGGGGRTVTGLAEGSATGRFSFQRPEPGVGACA
jgi:hypothetical protein